VLATDFDREYRRAFGKPHACPWANVIGHIRTKRLAVRQADTEANTIREGPPLPAASGMLAQVCKNLASCHARVFSCWRHLDDFPVDQLGFALDSV
jgi:hypothetical protein